MRAAIEDLRNRARWYREVPRSRTAVGPDRRDVEAEQADRAADLLESLSNPPETVGELRERVEKLAGDHRVSVISEDLMRHLGRYRVCVVPGPEVGKVDVLARGQQRAIRAAWFAIVGMTLGVERG